MLRLAEAADGLLARVRLPGGLVSAGQLLVLAGLAGELGDGRVELTSRGNVQLRGLRADAAGSLTSELTEAGLLPSLRHDRVRNVLASPLAGLDHGIDLTRIVRALDAGLCASERLAELPGRFLFAIDDGRGDVAGLGADVVATVRADGAVVSGLAVPVDDVPDVMLAMRRGVPRIAGGRWRHRLAGRRPARRRGPGPGGRGGPVRAGRCPRRGGDTRQRGRRHNRTAGWPCRAARD